MIDRPWTPRGRLLVRVYADGQLVEEDEGQNLVLTNAKSTLAQLLAGNVAQRRISHIGFGTRGDAPTVGDAAITGEYRRTVLGFSFPQPNQVAVAWALDDIEANGKSIREFGLVTVDGTLIARRTRGAAIEKTDRIRLDGTWTLEF